MFVAVIAVSLFICSSCAISSTNHQNNQDSTIINYEIKSKETNIPPAAETYSDNTVNWCIYNDGALVINGTNANTYNGHTGIASKGAASGTNLDLNNSYTSSGKPPWYNYRTSIKTVEFAQITKPISMSHWFRNCTKLTSINSTKLDTSAVTDLTGMFDYCSSLKNVDGLSDWDVSAVTDMHYMFYSCTNLSDLSGLSNWNVSAVTNMDDMFRGCSSLSDLSGLSKWKVSSVTDMHYMFSGCSGLTDLSGLSNWEFPAVTDMGYMFYQCSGLTDLNLSNWEFPAVTDMSYMFSGCSSLIIAHLDNWNPPENVDTKQMFCNCSELETIYCKYSWLPKYNKDMFQKCTKLKSETTGQTYNNGWHSNESNPVTGLFTIPVLGSFIPTIQKVILGENNQPVTNWTFESGQFTFIISSDDPNAPLPEETETQTDDNGQVIWEEIKYYDPGEYIYKIEEKSGNIPGMTYDTSPHEMKIIVK